MVTPWSRATFMPTPRDASPSPMSTLASSEKTTRKMRIFTGMPPAFLAAVYRTNTR